MYNFIFYNLLYVFRAIKFTNCSNITAQLEMNMEKNTELNNHNDNQTLRYDNFQRGKFNRVPYYNGSIPNMNKENLYPLSEIEANNNIHKRRNFLKCNTQNKNMTSSSDIVVKKSKYNNYTDQNVNTDESHDKAINYVFDTTSGNNCNFLDVSQSEYMDDLESNVTTIIVDLNKVLGESDNENEFELHIHGYNPICLLNFESEKENLVNNENRSNDLSSKHLEGTAYPNVNEDFDSSRLFSLMYVTNVSYSNEITRNIWEPNNDRLSRKNSNAEELHNHNTNNGNCNAQNLPNNATLTNAYALNLDRAHSSCMTEKRPDGYISQNISSLCHTDYTERGYYYNVKNDFNICHDSKNYINRRCDYMKEQEATSYNNNLKNIPYFDYNLHYNETVKNNQNKRMENSIKICNIFYRTWHKIVSISDHNNIKIPYTNPFHNHINCLVVRFINLLDPQRLNINSKYAENYRENLSKISIDSYYSYWHKSTLAVYGNEYIQMALNYKNQISIEGLVYEIFKHISNLYKIYLKRCFDEKNEYEERYEEMFGKEAFLYHDPAYHISQKDTDYFCKYGGLKIYNYTYSFNEYEWPIYLFVDGSLNLYRNLLLVEKFAVSKYLNPTEWFFYQVCGVFIIDTNVDKFEINFYIKLGNVFLMNGLYEKKISVDQFYRELLNVNEQVLLVLERD